MYWSEVIWKMVRDERKSISEVVRHFNNPFVTEEYVKTALENIQGLKRPPKMRGWKVLHKRKGPAPEGTEARRIWDLVETKGGIEAFKKRYSEIGTYALAREWGITPNQAKIYRRDHITGRRYEAAFRATVRGEIGRRYKAGLRKRNMKKDLW